MTHLWSKSENTNTPLPIEQAQALKWIMAHNQVDVVYQQLVMPLLAVLLLGVIPLVLLLLVQRIIHGNRSSNSNDDSNKLQQQALKRKDLIRIPPPSPPGLPIIGHLHLIGGQPQASLRDLAKKHGHGGLMLLRLGSVPNLIVSSARAAEAVMRTHDHVLASRPASMLAEAFLYGSSDITMAPYGEHWRKVRKLITTHLLGARKVQTYRLARQQEIQLVMAKVLHSQLVDMSDLLNTFSNDIVCRAVSSKLFRVEGRNQLFRELIEMNSRLFGGFNLLENYFPGLARSLPISWYLRSKAKEGHKRWDDLLEKIITDHESRPSSSVDDGLAEESDFIDVLLSVRQEYGITRYDIKGILMDMFSAGTDTSALVLEFAMAELMRSSHVMTKLQAEVRTNTPEGQDTVAEQNLATMDYLRAVVKETLRLHPPAPLLIPHQSTEDCELLDGYTIPSGTRVLINAWAISRDPQSWEKPEEFVPERFMDGGSAAGVDFKGNNFQLLPFGAGRRICPGLNFGLATVEIMLANLIYCFDWGLPDGMQTTGVCRMACRRLKEKFILVPKPRI